MPTKTRHPWERRSRYCRAARRRLVDIVRGVAAMYLLIGRYGCWPINHFCLGWSSTLWREWIRSPLHSSAFVMHHHHHHHLESRTADASSQSATPASALVVTTSVQQSRSTTSIGNTSSTMASQLHPDSATTTLVVRPDKKHHNASLSSPRLWLESQSPLNGGGGAYTVLRCDYYNKNDDNPANENATSDQASSRNHSWTVWGRDFHMQRLRESMSVLVKQHQQHAAVAPVPPLEAHHYDQAEIETDRILNQLLHECVRHRLYGNENNNKHNNKKAFRTVFMVTLLWTLSLPSSSDANQANGVLNVQGHICRATTSSGDDANEDEAFPFANYAPQPLTVVVAYDRHGSQNLPNRQPYPRAKLSAWCRERRPLEDRFRNNCYEAHSNNDTLSAVAVDEILLVRQQQQQQQENDDSVILLEGLTSNLFALYPNGVLRTADDQNVLPGYARHLVMTPGQNDNEIRKVDSRTPIRLNEADQWQQVFVTSAIRLIVPVGRILVVAEERDIGNGCQNGQRRVVLREIWNQNLTGTNVSNKKQTLSWRKIYKSIIEEQYHHQ